MSVTIEVINNGSFEGDTDCDSIRDAFGKDNTNFATLKTAVEALQTLDPEIAAIEGLTSAANTFPYYTGPGAAALATLTSFIRSLLDDADAAAARSTLGAAEAGPVGDSEITMNTARILGRWSASTGAVQEATIGTGLDLSASGVLSCTVTGGGGLTSVYRTSSSTLDMTANTYVTQTVSAIMKLPVANSGNDGKQVVIANFYGGGALTVQKSDGTSHGSGNIASYKQGWYVCVDGGSGVYEWRRFLYLDL